MRDDLVDVSGDIEKRRSVSGDAERGRGDGARGGKAAQRCERQLREARGCRVDEMEVPAAPGSLRRLGGGWRGREDVEELPTAPGSGTRECATLGGGRRGEDCLCCEGELARFEIVRVQSGIGLTPALCNDGVQQTKSTA